MADFPPSAAVTTDGPQAAPFPSLPCHLHDHRHENPFSIEHAKPCVCRTFEDCRAVRRILGGLRVAVDELDVSMDAAFRGELTVALEGRTFTVPQVFVVGCWIGGVEEICRMDEAGELGRVLEGVARRDLALACGGCGGARFVPCSTCWGARKVFDEKERRVRRCVECNENGLVRCPNCCY